MASQNNIDLKNLEANKDNDLNTGKLNTLTINTENEILTHLLNR